MSASGGNNRKDRKKPAEREQPVSRGGVPAAGKVAKAVLWGLGGGRFIWISPRSRCKTTQ